MPREGPQPDKAAEHVVLEAEPQETGEIEISEDIEVSTLAQNLRAQELLQDV